MSTHISDYLGADIGVHMTNWKYELKYKRKYFHRWVFGQHQNQTIFSVEITIVRKHVLGCCTLWVVARTHL